MVFVVAGSARAADVIGALTLHGSEFFNAVDTTCIFKEQEGGIAATCENDGKSGACVPAK